MSVRSRGIMLPRHRAWPEKGHPVDDAATTVSPRR